MMKFIKNFFKSVEDYQGYQPERVTTDAPPPNPPPKNPNGLPEPKETPPMPPVVEPPKPKKPRKPRAKKPKVEPVVETPISPTASAKEAATKNGEPWVAVVGINMDLDGLGSGNFELDWNEIFVARLVKAGYQGKDDVAIVDQWFTDLCKNIVLESFEQEMADPEKREAFTNRTRLENGRTEVR